MPAGAGVASATLSSWSRPACACSCSPSMDSTPTFGRATSPGRVARARLGLLAARVATAETTDPAREWTTIATGQPPADTASRARGASARGDRGPIPGGRLAARGDTGDGDGPAAPDAAHGDLGPRTAREHAFWEVAALAGLRTVTVNWWTSGRPTTGTGWSCRSAPSSACTRAAALDARSHLPASYERLRAGGQSPLSRDGPRRRSDAAWHRRWTRRLVGDLAEVGSGRERWRCGCAADRTGPRALADHSTSSRSTCRASTSAQLAPSGATALDRAAGRGAEARPRGTSTWLLDAARRRGDPHPPPADGPVPRTSRSCSSVTRGARARRLRQCCPRAWGLRRGRGAKTASAPDDPCPAGRRRAHGAADAGGAPQQRACPARRSGRRVLAWRSRMQVIPPSSLHSAPRCAPGARGVEPVRRRGRPLDEEMRDRLRSLGYVR